MKFKLNVEQLDAREMPSTMIPAGHDVPPPTPVPAHVVLVEVGHGKNSEFYVSFATVEATLSLPRTPGGNVHTDQIALALEAGKLDLPVPADKKPLLQLNVPYGAFDKIYLLEAHQFVSKHLAMGW